MFEFRSTFKTFFQEGMIFRFQFSINRVPMCIMHRAIDLAFKDKLKEVLFPTGQRSLHRSYLPRSDCLKVKNPRKIFKASCNTDTVILSLSACLSHMTLKFCFPWACKHTCVQTLCLSIISLTNLRQNLEQNKAVQHIVAATAKPAPYLVFGPPGTGTLHACVCELSI